MHRIIMRFVKLILGILVVILNKAVRSAKLSDYRIVVDNAINALA